jgi:chaperonin GroES
MNLKPLEDVVIIKHQTEEKVGEILIPIDAKDFAEDIGTVRFTGPGKVGDDGKLLPMFVKPGDKVLYSTHGHQVTKINGEELIILRQPSIIGVFSD